MNRQSGISTTGIALVVVALGAAGGGAFAWQQHQELARTKGELASTRSALDQASADARTAKADAAAARKEVEEQKAALQQARSDAESAKAFMESEKAHAARLQAELSLAREQIAFMRARAQPSQYSQPMLVQPRIMAIERAPVQGMQVQRAAPAAAPAPASGQGYAR